MQTNIAERTDISAIIIYAMRQSGATLQQIADEIGRTKERVRQILKSNYGSTECRLISTEQLCKLLGLPRNRVIELYQNGVIDPAREWSTGRIHHILWSKDVLEQITLYYRSHKLCRMCGSPVPVGRQVHCSQRCYEEGSKYKHRNFEAKQSHLRSIKRYRERCKQLAKASVTGDLKCETLPV